MTMTNDTISSRFDILTIDHDLSGWIPAIYLLIKKVQRTINENALEFDRVKLKYVRL